MLAVACAGPRSANTKIPQPPVDDRRPVPAPQSKHTHFDRRGEHGWVTDPSPAGGVTPLDEVADSSWFTNRNAVRPLSPHEIRTGPALHPRPRDDRKWTIFDLKNAGVSLGVHARDEAGDDFILKFDLRGHDEVETGADVVVQRLLFAAGYNVPENDIVYLRREGLSVDPGAAVSSKDGTKRPLHEVDIDAVLARAARTPDGRYRALASRVLPGKSLGGISAVGTREDDPNDQIRHEDRRDMRGLYSIAAWLNHTDVKPGNTRDVWIPDSTNPSLGHVVHYLLDFGKSLGAMSRIDGRLEAGFAHMPDTDRVIAQHALEGTPVPWYGIGPFPDHRGLGWIEADSYDPSRWKPLYHWLPFEKADRLDKFWGARIVASFTPQQIRAALDAARYSDPRTVNYLARVLVERQRKTVTELFSHVAPLDRFEIRGDQLCFVDLWTRHDLGGPPAKYTALFDNAGVSSGRIAAVSADGTACFKEMPTDHPTELEIVTARPGRKTPRMVVRIATPSGRPPHVSGIERR